MRVRYMAVLVSVLALGQQAAAQELAGAIQQALETHPQVQAGVNSRLAADYQLKAAKGGYLPSIDLRGGYGREGTDSRSTRGEGDHWRTLSRGESSLNLSQMVFDGFATSSEVGRQSAIVNSRAYGLLATSELVALDAVEVYLEVLRRHELVRLAEENYRSHQRIYDQISLRAERGIGSTADRDQADARLAQAHNNLITEQTNLADARVNYLSVIGHEPGDLIPPSSASLVLPESLEEARKRMLENNPQLRSAESDIMATERQYDAAKSTFFPHFDVEISRSANNDIDGARGHENEWQAMLRMRYNLFSGGSNKAELRARSYQVNEALDVRNNALRVLNEELGMAWNAVLNARAQKPVAEQYAAYSQRVREAYQQQFGLGDRTLLDLLDSENELFTAQRRLVDVDFAGLYSQYRVKAAMGELLRSQGVVAPLASAALSEVNTRVELPGLN